MTAHLDIPPKALRHLRNWARRRNQSVTIFDLETTTNIPHVKWMGITEVGMMMISPTGTINTISAFVDPERSIPPRVREITGIQNADVQGQPTWAAWAQRLDQLAREHVMVGYNSAAFDCIVVINQNARYGVEDTEFRFSLDVMALPGVGGTLGDVGERFGITSDTLHRALADVWLTAQIAERLAEKLGLDVLDASLRRQTSQSSRALREEELLTAYRSSGQIPDLAEFAEKHGIKASTAEGDVERLVSSGAMPNALLENPAVQDWLALRLPEVIQSCWAGDGEKRLKPLMLRLQDGAPEGFTYVQLRIGIASWRGDKPAD